MSKFINEVKRVYHETKKSSIIVYFILRFLVILYNRNLTKIYFFS